MKKTHLQLTLALLKPDITPMSYSVHKIQDMIIENDFLVVRSKVFPRLTKSRVRQFYAEHEGKFFFNRLVTFMSSGPVHAYVLAREDGIQHWRSLMGPTKVFKTRFEQPMSIRGQFGLTDTRNVSHGSDSDETARREIQFFFPDFDQQDFFLPGGEADALQQPGKAQLDRVNFLHYFVSRKQ